jgi:hypothetical protein
MMRRMMADMETLMSMPLSDSQQMIRSVMRGFRQVPAGSGVITFFFSTSSGVCSQTIIYGPASNRGQPVVKVSSGNACGAIRSGSPISVAQPAPAPRPVSPPREKLWTIGYPPHAIPVNVRPHT